MGVAGVTLPGFPVESARHGMLGITDNVTLTISIQMVAITSVVGGAAAKLVGVEPWGRQKAPAGF